MVPANIASRKITVSVSVYLIISLTCTVEFFGQNGRNDKNIVSLTLLTTELLIARIYNAFKVCYHA
jgi:hypothetical protein